MARPRFVRLGSAPRPFWLQPEAIADVDAVEGNPFEYAEYEGRIERIRARLVERELAAVLVFRPSSVDYASGHHTVETAPQPLLVTLDEVRLYVPDPEVGRAIAAATIDTIAHYSASEDELALVAADVAHVCGAEASVAVEDRDSRVPPRMAAFLEDVGVNVVRGEFLVEKIRLVLSPAEIECMERAAEVTKRGVEAALDAARRSDATDSQLAAAIGSALRANADSSAAMDVIVATGARGGVPHSTFNDLPLAGGTTFIEFAGTDHRYHAPVMLTVAREVDSVARRLERTAQTMLAAVLREIQPGRVAGDVAREVRSELTFESRDIFHFNFGYSIGLAHPPGWFDGAPFSIVEENERPLESGMAFHVPGSLRSFGRCGVGLSHAILLEDDGARVVTGGSHPHIHVLGGD